MFIKSKLHEIKESFKGKKMAPAFNAFHTFLFTPNDVTSNGTHVKVADDLKRTMNTVIMSLVPCLIFGIFIANFLVLVEIKEDLIFLFLKKISTFKFPENLLEYSGIKMKDEDLTLA